MTATQFLPTPLLAQVVSFVQYSSTPSALQSALTAAFPQAGAIQVFADGDVAGNALVVANDEAVFSVPANSWVGWVNGQWSQYTPTQMTGQAGTAYGPYFNS